MYIFGDKHSYKPLCTYIYKKFSSSTTRWLSPALKYVHVYTCTIILLNTHVHNTLCVEIQ